MKRQQRLWLSILLSVCLALGPAVAGAVDLSSLKLRQGQGGWVSVYNNLVDAVDSSLTTLETAVTSLGNQVTNWITTVDSLTLIQATPTYSDDHTFTLPGDYSAVLTTGKRIVAYCGADGAQWSKVVSCTYVVPNSTVVVDQTNLTNNLESVSYFATRSGTNTYGTGDVVAGDFGTPSWANLQAAVALAEAGGRRLLLTPGTWPVSDDLAPTCLVEAVPGAIFQVATTKTLTLARFDGSWDKHFDLVGTATVTLAQGAVQFAVPQWWGAAGDGITDDSAAFNAMFQAVGAFNSVFVPATEAFYNMGTTQVVVPTIVDLNSNHALLKWGAVAEAALKFNFDYVTLGVGSFGNKAWRGLQLETTDKDTLLVWAPYGLKYLTLLDNSFTGAWDTPDAATTTGKLLQVDGKFGDRENWTSDQLVVRNCHFQNSDTLIYLNGDAQGSPRTGIDAFMDAKLFENNYLDHFRMGVVMEYCHNILFLRNTIAPPSYAYLQDSQTDGGWRFHLTESTGITYQGNYWENVDGPGSGAKIYLNNGYNENTTYAPITMINNSGCRISDQIGTSWRYRQTVGGTSVTGLHARGLYLSAGYLHYYTLEFTSGSPDTFTWTRDGGAASGGPVSVVANTYLRLEGEFEVMLENDTGRTTGDTVVVYCIPAVVDTNMPKSAGVGTYNKKHRVNFWDADGQLTNNLVMSPNIVWGSGANAVLHTAINDNGCNPAITTNYDPVRNRAIGPEDMLTLEFINRSSTTANNFISIRIQKPGAGQTPSWAHSGVNPTYGTEIARITYDGQLKLPVAAAGIYLTNAAGTVTKKVRLNDAGDGFIFE